MMGPPGPSQPPRYVVIVRRDRPAVYQRLTDLAIPGVDLFWDRRLAQRRTTDTPVQVDWRRRERRHPAPETWSTLGFAIQRAVPRFD